jgi:hypothetical protein
MRKKVRAKQTRKKDKHQVHCVGFHSAKRTHTNRSSSKKKRKKRQKTFSSRA